VFTPSASTIYLRSGGAQHDDAQCSAVWAKKYSVTGNRTPGVAVRAPNVTDYTITDLINLENRIADYCTG
jgi:hypothetical protein